MKMIAFYGFDSGPIQEIFCAVRRKTRDGYDPPFRTSLVASTRRHPRERRPHLAARAEHDDVAVDTRQCRDRRLARR